MAKRTYSDDEIQKMARGSGSLSDTSETLVIEPWRKYVANVLTSNRTKTFDSSNISQGQRVSFFNADAAQDLILQDDSSSDVYTLGPGMHVELEALVDAPTDGADWAKVAGSTIIEVLDTTGNWDPPAFVHRIWAEVYGGGGGGKAGEDQTSDLCESGAGGGAGGVAEAFIKVTPGTPIAYGIGAGGAGGASEDASGADGAATTFGSMTANGGLAGDNITGSSQGGSASGGDINRTGGPGSGTILATASTILARQGGSNGRGIGGGPSSDAYDATNGSEFGGGGGGGGAASLGGSSAWGIGGDGGDGRVLLKY